MRKFWQKRFAKWLDNRIPGAKQYQLDLSNIFIFPSKFGWLFLLLTFCLFLLGTNYQNNLMLLLCYFLLAIMLLNLFVAYLNFAKLQLHANTPNSVFVDDQVFVSIQISSTQAAHGLVSFEFWQQPDSKQFDLDDSDDTLSLPYLCQQRGLLQLPRVTIESRFPMGLYRCWTHLAFEQEVMVYPKPISCAMQLHAVESDGDIEQGLASRRGNDDFFSLKPYQLGEPLNHIAWKQVAKGQTMLSKEFSSPVAQTGWLRLLPCSSDALEKRLGQLSFQILQLTQAGYVFGLDLGKQKITPATGLAHQHACLTALALFQLS